MKSVQKLTLRVAREEEAAAATEYAIVVAFVASAVAATVKLYDLQAVFAEMSAHVWSVLSSAIG